MSEGNGQWAWEPSSAPLVFAAAVYAAECLLIPIFVLVLILTGGAEDLSGISLVYACGFSAMLWTVLVATTVIPWYLKSAGIRVSVDDSRLVVARRTRTLLECPLDTVIQARVYGWASWSTVANPSGTAGGSFPRLVLWTPERWESPPLLLWREAAQAFEAELGHQLGLKRP